MSHFYFKRKSVPQISNYNTNMFMDIIQRLIYISKHDVSESGFCLRLPVKPIQLRPIDIET